MNKLFFALLLCFFALLCSAQEIFTLSQDNQKVVYVSIPMDNLIFAAETDKASYLLSLQINNTEKQSVYQNVFTIDLHRSQQIAGAAILLKTTSQLAQGMYRAKISLRNPMLGDKIEKTQVFQITAAGVFDETPKIIAENQSYSFIPFSFEQLRGELLSVCMYNYIDTPIDSIIVQYSADNQQYQALIKSVNQQKVDLLPYFDGRKISALEVKYYCGNIVYRASPDFYHSWYSYGQKYSLKDQLQQIKYIANQNEWKKLKNLSNRELSIAIEQFWEKHNPHPGSSKNATRDMFYSRVITADEQFTIHKKLLGWRSDRGRIFIKYGPADEIVSDIYPSGMYPYIVWYYYRENKTFRFFDKTGYGNFQLMDEDNED
jgi:GWxTD domain-containing protein